MRGRILVRALGVLVWFGAPGIQPALAAPPPATHGAMLDSVARLVTSDLLLGASLPAGRTIRIATPLTGDTLGLLTQRMVEQLRARGAEVRLVPAPQASGTVVGAWNHSDGPRADSVAAGSK